MSPSHEIITNNYISISHDHIGLTNFTSQLTSLEISTAIRNIYDCAKNWDVTYPPPCVSAPLMNFEILTNTIKEHFKLGQNWDVTN